MVNLQENENVLILTSEDKFQLRYDTFGLVSFLLLGLILINPYKSLELAVDDLIGGWFTALTGSVLCLSLILTKEHTSRWIFDKESSCFFVEYRGVIGYRRFKSPLVKIRSVKVTYLSTGSVQMFLPDLDLVLLTEGETSVEKINNYAKAITNFLDLAQP